MTVTPVQTTLFDVKVNATVSLVRLSGSGRQESCPPFRYFESESESRSVVSDSATPRTVQSMEFSRPEYWSG